MGVFEPSPIPQCLYGKLFPYSLFVFKTAVLEDNMEVIPTSQHEKYTLIENFLSGHSYSGIDGGFAHVLRPTHKTVCLQSFCFKGAVIASACRYFQKQS